jgi:membrane protease YdiL (CAAX protease family)
VLDPQGTPQPAVPQNAAEINRVNGRAAETAHASESSESSPPVSTASAPAAGARLRALAEVIACSGFPTQLLVMWLLSAFGVQPRISASYVASLLAFDTVLVVGLMFAFLHAHDEPPARLFLDARRIRREVLVGLVLLPVAFILIAGASQIIERFAPWLRSDDGNPLTNLLKRPQDIILFAVVAVLAGGVREEMQRAFVLHRFEEFLGGAVLGIVLFSLAFGAGHALQGWDATIMTGLLGALWGIVYLWRRSIVAPVVCHAVFNLVEVVYHGTQA